MEKLPDNSIRSICVYCGSSPGHDPAFMESATALGKSIGEAGLRLVYGGGDHGLMGAVARATLDAQGQVLGIIPEFLKQYEHSTEGVDIDDIQLEIVPDMHTRKHAMFEHADAFVALPGGIGTLEELVEILTWAQLERHQKPVVLLNVNDFWTPYFELMQHMEDAGFLHNAERAKPLVYTDAAEIVPALQAI